MFWFGSDIPYQEPWPGNKFGEKGREGVDFSRTLRFLGGRIEILTKLEIYFDKAEVVLLALGLIIFIVVLLVYEYLKNDK